MIFTVIGGQGFIGSAIVRYLRLQGEEVFVPDRNDNAIIYTRSLGHVIYAAGVTSDFRRRPFDTVRAHIGHLVELLEAASFDSFLYLSSARIYRHADHSHENATIAVRSEDLEDFYDITKLGGEALCHASRRQNVKVVRLSNVVGPDFSSTNFVFDLIRSAYQNGYIKLQNTLDSSKDYVLLDDVVKLLPQIAVSGKYCCYNVASGSNITHAEIVKAVIERINVSCMVVPQATQVISPAINICRVRDEFGFSPRDVLPEISILAAEYGKTTNVKN